LIDTPQTSLVDLPTYAQAAKLTQLPSFLSLNSPATLANLANGAIKRQRCYKRPQKQYNE